MIVRLAKIEYLVLANLICHCSHSHRF